MKRFRQFAIIGFLTIACSLQMQAHALLDHSEPMAGQALETGPEQLRMWFTQPVKAALSSIEVFDTEGKPVDKRDLHTDKANAKLVRLSLHKLAPGTYKVVWNAVADDLHATKGNFVFHVAQ
jgi:methionine-rich copper-binding protein CopC